MRPRVCLLIAVLALLSTARAEAHASDTNATAQVQFRQGREALKRGDYATALKLFRKSQELLPTPGTLLNLANCEKELGSLVSARLHFQQALAQLPPRDVERTRFVNQNLAAIEPRIPRLQIKLAPGSVTGARVMLDDAVVAADSLGTDLMVDPGKHTIVVSASNLPDRHYETTLQEGKSASITVEPGVRESPPPPPPPSDPVPASSAPPPAPPPPPSTSGQRIAGFVVGGVGLAGLGVGGVTGGLALSKKSELEKECPDPMKCSSEGIAKANAGKTLSIVSTVSLIAGGVGLGVGLVLVLTGGNSTSKPATTVGLSVLPDGAAIGMAGSF